MWDQNKTQMWDLGSDAYQIKKFLTDGLESAGSVGWFYTSDAIFFLSQAVT